MIEGEARMDELSAQLKEVRVAHDGLADRKASLRVRYSRRCDAARRRSPDVLDSPC